ncbi:DinB family protein [Nocardia brasiliensis]|uniref:DinB family protein n=1 Tax=Nocardia brasiliensis TaxID=37326 RepID=UPI0004A6E9AC|nr:DinB family protein [Nocardia brasiliensis]MBF6130988.1 DinB family protein [Nocardia brasiliensis]
MNWIAPEVPRTAAPHVADERSMLQGWLDFHRRTLLAKCAGLDDEQLRRRSAEPSTLTLLGLVRHLTEVERGWFRLTAAAMDVPYAYGSEEAPDGDFDLREADAATDFATFLREIELSDAAVADLPLDHTFRHPRRPELEYNLRWIYLHMIEEYARHNGHADLLRERIDGTTGA